MPGKARGGGGVSPGKLANHTSSRAPRAALLLLLALQRPSRESGMNGISRPAPLRSRPSRCKLGGFQSYKRPGRGRRRGGSLLRPAPAHHCPRVPPAIDLQISAFSLTWTLSPVDAESGIERLSSVSLSRREAPRRQPAKPLSVIPGEEMPGACGEVCHRFRR